MISDWPWTLNSQKYPVYTKYLTTTTPAQILFQFALPLALFEIQGWRKSEKSEMYPMTSEWPWTLNSQKYHVYSKYHRGPNAVRQFQDIIHHCLPC